MNFAHRLVAVALLLLFSFACGAATTKLGTDVPCAVCSTTDGALAIEAGDLQLDLDLKGVFNTDVPIQVWLRDNQSMSIEHDGRRVTIRAARISGRAVPSVMRGIANPVQIDLQIYHQQGGQWVLDSEPTLYPSLGNTMSLTAAEGGVTRVYNVGVKEVSAYDVSNLQAEKASAEKIGNTVKLATPTGTKVTTNANGCCVTISCRCCPGSYTICGGCVRLGTCPPIVSVPGTHVELL